VQDFLPVKAVTLDFIWRMTGNKIGDSRLNIYRCFRHCCVKVQQPQSNAQMLIALFVIWRAPNPAFDQITTQSFKPCTPRNRTFNTIRNVFYFRFNLLCVSIQIRIAYLYALHIMQWSILYEKYKSKMYIFTMKTWTCSRDLQKVVNLFAISHCIHRGSQGSQIGYDPPNFWKI